MIHVCLHPVGGPFGVTKGREKRGIAMPEVNKTKHPDIQTPNLSEESPRPDGITASEGPKQLRFQEIVDHNKRADRQARLLKSKITISLLSLTI